MAPLDREDGPSPRGHSAPNGCDCSLHRGRRRRTRGARAGSSGRDARSGVVPAYASDRPAGCQHRSAYGPARSAHSICGGSRVGCGMWELRARAITARDCLSELDPDDEIAAIPLPVRKELIGGECGLAGRLRRGEGLDGGDGGPAGSHGGGGRRIRSNGRVLHPDGGPAQRLGAADAAPRPRPEGCRIRRLKHLRGDREGLAGRPSAGDDPNHGLCLGEDEQGIRQRGTATRA